ncbi:MAG TPA: endonuclease/exonuclease/phosphatase family protein [Arachidicoccus soli]|nr:endonuclease/exonuclease/phosphatase family protein [Arachidicoccus soli]
MAFKFIRKLTRGIFLIPTILLAILFVAACLASELNPEKWWFVAFLSLLLPYLILLLLFAFIFWLFAKPKAALIPLLALLIGWRQIKVIFSYHIFSSFNNDIKVTNAIRIITWNVGSMYGLSHNKDKRMHDRKEIANTIIGLSPDIICLQEFNNSETQGKEANNVGLFSKDYPYYFFSKDLDKHNGFYQSGSIIFSKYPIIDSAKIKYPKGISESFIYVDILRKKDTIRIFNVHLQSYKFSPQDYDDIAQIKSQSDSTIKASISLMNKMQLAFSRRGVQADMIQKYSDSSRFKSILCGDFNDVPGSYAYFKIRGSRQDAFLKKSWGIGRTYYSIAPTLRIDYIMPDKDFTVNQFDIVDEDLSDHLLLASDIVLNPKK